MAEREVAADVEDTDKAEDKGVAKNLVKAVVKDVAENLIRVVGKGVSKNLAKVAVVVEDKNAVGVEDKNAVGAEDRNAVGVADRIVAAEDVGQRRVPYHRWTESAATPPSLPPVARHRVLLRSTSKQWVCAVGDTAQLVPRSRFTRTIIISLFRTR